MTSIRPIRAVACSLVLLIGFEASGQVVVGPRAAVPPPAGIDHATRPPGRLLGTFYPEPTVNIMGSGPARGGYSPLDMYGPTTLSLYGPFSAFRVKSAPITIYQRGYDGILRPSVGISLSYPNFPAASPVVYPTRANVDHGFPSSGVPPWWRRAETWLDQD